MGFSFGFNQDDLDDEFDDSVTPVVASKVDSVPTISAIDKLSSTIPKQNLPMKHELTDILLTLVDVRVTFENFYTPIGNNLIYRRALFDVKHQIMCEDADGAHQVLNDENDLQKNVYEGGFKSWECSYDTIDKLTTEKYRDDHQKILDLGCGTSLPSSYILKQFFEQETKNKTLVFSDFNYEVIRLVTVPNLIVNWASTLPVEDLFKLTDGEEKGFNNDEVLITKLLVEEFLNQLSSRSIELQFISGSWGNQFNDLIGAGSVDVLISSETIYSLDTLPVVAETILRLKSAQGKALVSAKNIYFGVGGSIIEFLTYFNSIKPCSILVSTEEINDSQLKRSIITIQ
jgi:protein-histidine N-methyltransferase